MFYWDFDLHLCDLLSGGSQQYSSILLPSSQLSLVFYDVLGSEELKLPHMPLAGIWSAVLILGSDSEKEKRVRAGEETEI